MERTLLGACASGCVKQFRSSKRYSNFKGDPLGLLDKFHLKENVCQPVRKFLTIRLLANAYAKENRCLSPLQLCEAHQAIRVVNEIFDTVRNFVKDNHRVEVHNISTVAL